MSKNVIGENIKKYRMMVGYTQAELASELSEVVGKTVAASAIAGYESGQRVPKVEVRVQIARILGVDPVALSGIELTVDDEKRLLCKLLFKYGSNISLEDDGSVNLDLSDDFSCFQMEYSENRNRLDFNIEGMDEDSLEYMLTRQSADDEMDYWIETYPAYDATSLCKEKKADCTVTDIKKYREMTRHECQMRFFKFQDSYLTPLINQEIMKKIRKQ